MYHVVATDDVRGSFSFQKVSPDQEIKRKKWREREEELEEGRKGWKCGNKARRMEERNNDADLS